jgi:hypothetical protein
MKTEIVIKKISIIAVGNAICSWESVQQVVPQSACRNSSVNSGSEMSARKQMNKDTKFLTTPMNRISPVIVIKCLIKSKLSLF